MQSESEAGGTDGVDRWDSLAQKYWAKPLKKSQTIKSDVVRKEIWDVLEAESFDFRSILQLEGLQLLERLFAAPI